MSEDRAKWFKLWIDDPVFKLPKDPRQRQIMTDAMGEALGIAIDYASGEPLPEETSPLANLYFSRFKTWVDLAQKKYKTMSENGKKGGAPEGNKNAKKVIELKKRIEEERAAGILKTID